jgi:hypothetical protein
LRLGGLVRDSMGAVVAIEIMIIRKSCGVNPGCGKATVRSTTMNIKANEQIIMSTKGRV